MQQMHQLIDFKEEAFAEGKGAFRLTWLETVETKHSTEGADSHPYPSIELETVEVHQLLSYASVFERAAYLQFIHDVGACLISETAKIVNDGQLWARGEILELRYSLERGRSVAEIANLLRRREDDIRTKSTVLGLTHLLK